MPKLTVYIEKDPEIGLYVAVVPEIRGNTADSGFCVTKLVLIDSRKMDKLLLKLGFKKIRKKNSSPLKPSPQLNVI